MSSSLITHGYISGLMCEVENKIVLYSIETSDKNINTCPCGLIYKIKKKDDCVFVYIMFIATRYRYRKFGYASLFIKSFIEFITNKYADKYNHIRIVLDSLESSVTFYEHYGFKYVIDSQYDDELHINDDDIKNYIEHFIMVYDIK